jgi:hypothetical protein
VDHAADPNPLTGLGNRAADFRFPVRDRARQFTTSSGAVLASAGIEAVKIPPRSPRANAYAERRVRTARVEVTDRMLIAGPRHLRVVMTEYVAHYNRRRPHRSRELRPPRLDHPIADWSGCILILAPGGLAHPGAATVPLLGRERSTPTRGWPPAGQTPDRDGAPARAPRHRLGDGNLLPAGGRPIRRGR